jgi:hypothetical protein
MAQARKPLSALRTFGAMLQLRVARSDPSSDMATGVVIQVSDACCSCCSHQVCGIVLCGIRQQIWHLLSVTLIRHLLRIMQGDQLHSVLQQLQHALHPSSSSGQQLISGSRRSPED